MKTGLTLEAFAAQITATAQSARDFILPAKLLRMTPGGELAFNAGQEGIMFPTNKTASQQIASYCEIPAQYYERCPASLRSVNVNHWLDTHAEDKRMVRTADGHVRALLSDRYRPLDNYDLASHILPIIHESGLTVESAQVTETNLYLKCIDAKIMAEMNFDDSHRGIHDGNKDILHPMVIVKNSETGHGALSVTSGIFRVVCKNGLISESKVRKNHAGDRRARDMDLDSALEVYCDDTRKKMDGALWSQVADLTRSAVSHAQFELIVAKMREAKTGEKIVKPDVACEVLRKHFTLTQVESSGILGHLAAGGDLSRFGMLNAVTRYAQDVESYDRSTELERIGGQILELNAKEWATVAV